MPRVAWRAVVLFAGAARRGVDRADRDAAFEGHDLDLHVVGIAAPRVLVRDHRDLTVRRRRGADVAVHASDLESFAWCEFARPAEVAALGRGRRGDAGQ